MDEVILVNTNNEIIGFMEKLEAHRKGLLHRAFSVFIFNNKKQLLLQKRAINKYHSGGLWTNTCCSHPAKDETFINAANRRLNQEMGMKCKLIPAFQFTYKAQLDNNLTEYEYDQVFIGFTNQKPVLNINEAEDYKYISLNDLKKDISLNSHSYTMWLKICFNKLLSHMNNENYL